MDIVGYRYFFRKQLIYSQYFYTPNYRYSIFIFEYQIRYFLKRFVVFLYATNKLKYTWTDFENSSAIRNLHYLFISDVLILGKYVFY